MFDEIFDRHDKVALSFSGGRDSLVLLHLARPWLDRITVYWLNPGNPFPETIALMSEIAASVPHFKEVKGFQAEVIEAGGWPSDIVPHRYTNDGNVIFGATPFRTQLRRDCCFRAIMMPLYQAMVEDGVTCILRGKRREEQDKTGIENGFISEDGLELQFPLLEWTEAEVTKYLSDNAIPVPESYAYAKHSLDCMDCTAWWGEGLGAYLKEKHAAAFPEYERRLSLIKKAVVDQLMDCEV